MFTCLLCDLVQIAGTLWSSLPHLHDATWRWQGWSCVEHLERCPQREGPHLHLSHPAGWQGQSRSPCWAGTSRPRGPLSETSYAVSCPQFQKALKGLGGLFTFRETAQNYHTSQPQPPSLPFNCCISLSLALNTPRRWKIAAKAGAKCKVWLCIKSHLITASSTLGISKKT